MSLGFKADPSGLYGTVTIDGVDSLVINKDGSIVGDNFVDSNGQLLSAGATNHIIDGDFNFWYEGTSQTVTGYGSDTVYRNNNTGTTKTHSRQSFTPGHLDVPGNPKYFSRTVVSSVAGASNFCNKQQKLESVSKLSGKEATFSFWAKADSSKNISIEFQQYFGSGGSPSSTVTGIGVQKILLSTSWAKYFVTVDISSISGKIIGTDGNDTLIPTFWFDAGTNFDSRTDSLGHQSGTFDITRVRLVEGEVDGDIINENIEEVQSAISRHFKTSEKQRLVCLGSSSYASAGFIAYSVYWAVSMRATPAVSIVGVWSYPGSCSSGTIDDISSDGFRMHVAPTAINSYIEGGLNGTAGWATFDSRL